MSEEEYKDEDVNTTRKLIEHIDRMTSLIITDIDQLDYFEAFCTYEEDLLKSLPDLKVFTGKNRDDKIVRFQVLLDSAKGQRYYDIFDAIERSYKDKVNYMREEETNDKLTQKTTGGHGITSKKRIQ